MGIVITTVHTFCIFINSHCSMAVLNDFEHAEYSNNESLLIFVQTHDTVDEILYSATIILYGMAAHFLQ